MGVDVRKVLKVLTLALALANSLASSGMAPLSPAPSDQACIAADSDLRSGCPDPGAFTAELLRILNQHRTEPLSVGLAALELPKGTVVGAGFSESLQISDTLDNPRLYLMTACGPLTLNLYGGSFEFAAINQWPTERIGRNPHGYFRQAPGEILMEIHLPSEESITAAEIINHFNPRFGQLAQPADYGKRHLDVPQIGPYGETVLDPSGRAVSDRVDYDSHACSDCHVDISPGATGEALGQRPIAVGTESIDAIITPFARVPEEQSDDDILYCVKKDLPALYACRCQGQLAACGPFEDEGKVPGTHQLAKRSAPQIAEACARLRTVLALQPRQHCDFDPRREKNPQTCLSGQPRTSPSVIRR
jgi:hypothetical protein